MLRISRFSLVKNLGKSIGNADTRQRQTCMSRSLCSIATTTPDVAEKSKFTTFEELISQRRYQAQKSLLVQVNSERSYPELLSYCSQFGEIESAFHYTVADNELLNFILLEFREQTSYAEARDSCSFDAHKTRIPVVSPFLWFRAENAKKSKVRADNKTLSLPLRHDEVRAMEEETLNDLMSSAETLNDQIVILHRATMLSELGTRIRFMASRQLEIALGGMFPRAIAFPFGSSVNGFGRAGCDLDLILRLNDEDGDSKDFDGGSRLVYHTKATRLNERAQTQKQMEVIGDIMHFFLPAINNVRKILLARVPIIKYNHECLDLDIDFSMSNMSGFYMSELLYLYGELDERVRPLVFCIRKWASACGLTNSAAPGRWVTNFSLTVLVLFFLQNLKRPILPPFMTLKKAATAGDIRVTEDNVNCTFLRDLDKLQHKSNISSSNDDSMHILLMQFFDFYSNFNFQQHGVSLIEGRPIVKPDHSAMWITNPLEPELNVSKNVSFEELDRFKIEARNAAWSLESTIDKQKDSATWGVMNLLKGQKRKLKPEMFYESRLVNIRDLFGEEKDERSSDSDKHRPENIQFKNPAVKNAVKNIQKSTQKKISQLMKNS